MINKKCIQCLKYLSIEEFYKKTATRYYSHCKQCRSEYCKSKRRLKREANRDLEVGENQKRCTRCKCVKGFTEFYSTKSNKIGILAWCKKCELARKPIEKNREYSRQYRLKNREKVNKNTAEWFKAHPEYNRKNVQKWKDNNPIKYKALVKRSTSRRRAILKKIGGNFKTNDVLSLMKIQENRCYYCKNELTEKYHLDHKQPLSRNGSNSIENIAITCISCNLRKGYKTEIEFKQIIEQEKTNDHI